MKHLDIWLCLRAYFHTYSTPSVIQLSTIAKSLWFYNHPIHVHVHPCEMGVCNAHIRTNRSVFSNSPVFLLFGVNVITKVYKYENEHNNKYIQMWKPYLFLFPGITGLPRGKDKRCTLNLELPSLDFFFATNTSQTLCLSLPCYMHVGFLQP